MLYQLDFFTFYFYALLLFQIFAPWKFIKAYSYLLSLLQRTTSTHIAISTHTHTHTYICIYIYIYIYLFVSNIIQYYSIK